MQSVETLQSVSGCSLRLPDCAQLLDPEDLAVLNAHFVRCSPDLDAFLHEANEWYLEGGERVRRTGLVFDDGWADLRMRAEPTGLVLEVFYHPDHQVFSADEYRPWLQVPRRRGKPKHGHIVVISGQIVYWRAPRPTGVLLDTRRYG